MKALADLKYKRILLKLSGEALGGAKGFGLDDAVVRRVGATLRDVAAAGVQTAVVVGGGNFWRGRTGGEMDAVRADAIGMLATIMNAVALQDALRRLGADVLLQSAVAIAQIAPAFDRDAAVAALESDKIVLFGGGTGNPFFTTDTGAALRGAQIGADVLLKATNVDGVYDKDPQKYPDAVRYETLTFDTVLREELGVVDAAAAALCKARRLPLLVFSMEDPGDILRAARGEKVGTVVTV
jgi:uridylate kinase